MIDIKTLRKFVRCNPKTGTLFWNKASPEMFSGSEKRPAKYRCKIWNSMTNGSRAFTANDGSGYLCGDLLGVRYKAHRVIWAMIYGEWPKDEIDHINGDRADNRIENLRDVSRSTNQRNAARRRDNTSGVVGVSYVKRDNRWIAQISSDNGRVVVGRFATKEEAIIARRKSETDIGYHINHGRSSP